MKTLIILRHAKSSWETNEDDIDRPLNNRGIRDSPRMAKWLRSTNILPEKVYCSVSKRTTETLQLFMEAGSIEADIEYVPELYHAGLNSLVSLVKSFPDQLDRVMIVAHNYGVTDLINHMGNWNLDNLPTAGIGIIEFDISAWSDVTRDNGKTLEIMFPKKL